MSPDPEPDSVPASDPYALYALHRSGGSVYCGGIRELMHSASDESEPASSGREFVVLRLDDVQGMLRDRDGFSSACYGQLMPTIFEGTLASMDEPEHHAHRSLVAAAFTPHALERWQRDFIVPLVHRLIDQFAGDGRAELVQQLTFPFPIQVIAAILGLPEEEMPSFQRLAVDLFEILDDWDRGLDAAGRLGDYLHALLADRRRGDGDDLISALTHVSVDGRSLTDDEIVDFCRLLLPAGAETTFRASNSLLVGLLTHPEQLALVRRDPSFVGPAVEEGLRWEPPFSAVIRRARQDVTIDGACIPRGSLVYASIGSANHDERHWDRPDEFDITRQRHTHLAFGSGPHTCLGVHLARLELRVLLAAVLERLPDLALDPAMPVPVIEGTYSRTPSKIAAVFSTPAG